MAPESEGPVSYADGDVAHDGDSPEPIPFNKPWMVGQELDYIRDVIQAGHSAGDGKYGKLCEQTLTDITGVKRSLLTTSCTHALEMSALLLNLREGDEVIVPSFTFVSTANAYVLRGAIPIFADIRPDTLNLDESRLETLITPRTRAIVPVHYAGVACEMDAICEIAAGRDIAVVEDNAHGFMGAYRGKMLGSFGAMATQSFHETKNFTCGEGGALLLNDDALVDRAEIIREKGTNRKQFFRGQVNKYSWMDLGSSYVISDVLAAFLYAQLDARAEIQERRRRIWIRYAEELQGWAENNDVRLPVVPDHCSPSYHMFHLLLPSEEQRRSLIEHLKKASIQSVFHYLPLHLSPMGRQFGGADADCPVTVSVSDRLLRLPFYNDLSTFEQDRVIDRVLEWRRS